MKMKKTIFGILTILIFVLSSCSNSIEEKDSLKKNNLATLKICLNNNSRTVFPDTNLEELTNFEFQGMNGDYQEIRRSYSSILDLRNDEIKLETGEWNFTIFARKGNACYTATKNQNIVQGENNLFFELEIYESRYGNGSFSITLNFSETENSDKVTSATASLQNINGTSVSGFGVKSLSVNNGKVTYSENQIKTGSYRILITLYYGSQELLTWREIVVISNGLISSAERKLDSVNLYKITYELNDDENNSANFTDSALETYNRYSVVRTLPQVTRQYYTFEGWHLKEDLSDEVITKLPSSVNGNVSVYAKWHPLTYRINYEFNGGDNDNVTFVDYTPETNTFSLPDTKKAGYKFCGWYETLDFSGDPVSQIKKGSGGNKTLYAKWCLADISIIYELNDNEEYPASFVGEKLDKFNFETTTRTLPALNRPCYDFLGWCINEDLSDEPLTEVPDVYEESLKLYAKWKLHDFSINYNLNGGEWNNIEPISEFNIETSSVSLSRPYRVGYTFNGWYQTVDFSGDELVQVLSGTTSDISIYAKWLANKYTVVFDSNGGIGTMDNLICTYDHYSNLPNNCFTNQINSIFDSDSDFVLVCDDFENKNLQLYEWNTEADGTGISIKKSDQIYNLSIMDGDVITLYAQWRIGSFKRVCDDGTTNVIEVSLTKPFYMCNHEVTQAEYEAFCCEPKKIHNGSETNYPEYNVTWYDTLVYCNLRSLAEGLNPVYSLNGETNPKNWVGIKENNGKYSCSYTDSDNNTENYAWDNISCNFNANGYRLPTLAEWQYAALGGYQLVGTDISIVFSGYNGNNIVTDYGWNRNNSNGLMHEIKTKNANGYGLYDMSGNVFEWVWDWHDRYDTVNVINPVVSQSNPVLGIMKVLCGGSYGGVDAKLSVYSRVAVNSNSTDSSVGFRVCRSY